MSRRERHHVIDEYTDSEYGDEAFQNGNQPLSLLAHPKLPATDDQHCDLGVRGKSYMVLRTTSPMGAPTDGCDDQDTTKDTISFTSLLNSMGTPDSIMQKAAANVLQFLSNSQRMFWFFLTLFAIFYFYPVTCIVFVACILLILAGGHQNGDSQVTTRTAKWTINGYSHQIKDGFVASPPFLDKCGQWRLVIKQKRGMDGLQTVFGLMCTDIPQEVEGVTASVTVFCTNQLGQELSTGGTRDLKFHHDYQCPGDCGFSRNIRLSRRMLGESESITIHCTVEFRKKMVTFMRTLARNIAEDANGDESGAVGGGKKKKGKNQVVEYGEIIPGTVNFHEDDDLSCPEYRPVLRFIQHPQTRSFVWEIPGFCSLLEDVELWGLYSPQFFVNSHDICAIWRMKLLEVQGVFRLHVQLRGLPRSVKQVKLWYLLQLVDKYGNSVIPEHAVCRVKYPDHMNLWDTTRHILYRRETILERFIGGDNNGGLVLRISLQMEPNDLALMEVDSDEWIHCPRNTPEIGAGIQQESSVTHGMLTQGSLSHRHRSIEN